MYKKCLPALIAVVLFYYIRMRKDMEAGVEPTSDSADPPVDDGASEMAWAAQPLAYGDDASQEGEGWSPDEDNTSSPTRPALSLLGPDDWSTEDDAMPDEAVPPKWPDEEPAVGRTSDRSEDQDWSA